MTDSISDEQVNPDWSTKLEKVQMIIVLLDSVVILLITIVRANFLLKDS